MKHNIIESGFDNIRSLIVKDQIGNEATYLINDYKKDIKTSTFKFANGKQANNDGEYHWKGNHTHFSQSEYDTLRTFDNYARSLNIQYIKTFK
jgi:hypothetical protein